jgi:cell division protease FtsH
MTVALRSIRIVALVIIVLVLLASISRWLPPVDQLAEINYSTFLDDVKSNRVNSVVFQGDMLYGTLKDKQQFKIHKPGTDDSALIGTLKNAGVSIERMPPRRPIFPWLLLLLAPLLIILVIVRRPADR